MDILQLTASLQRDAVYVVFLNVLLQQIGLPVPAVPTLLLAGSLAIASPALLQILLMAVVASVLADLVWYVAGRAFGYRVLSGLCKLSINPGSCVSQTEAKFIRWGAASLVVAKFIPGFSTVAPPIAGALLMGVWGFSLAAAIGATLWAGLALTVGWVLRAQVHDAIQLLNEHMGSAVFLVIAFGLLWLGWKLWSKYKFKRLTSIPHISVFELVEAMESANPPVLLDLRAQSMVQETGPIPGAILASRDSLPEVVKNISKSQPIVTLCACPQDATAIQSAQDLIRRGYISVRPLKGGYDAWISRQ